MSTENDELKDRENTLGQGRENSLGVYKTGFHDVTGKYPRANYFFGPSINTAARGITRNDLYVGGGNLDLSLDLDKPPVSQYPFNQVNESRSGHVIEIDDTPSGERILIRHKTGAGVEMRADGTILIATKNNHVTVVQGDSKVIIEGDADLQYNGNLNLDVAGDYNLKIGGNYNINVAGDEVKEIDGNYRERVHGNHNTIIDGNKGSTTTGTSSETSLKGYNNVVQGNYRTSVEGKVSISASDQIKTTSEKQVVVSAPDINIAAQVMSVFGDTGTIGGENIVMYNYNMYTGHSITATDTITTNTAYTQRVNATSMHATTFHGSLVGKASFAAQADEAGSAPLGAGSGGGTLTSTTHTAEPVDPKATALPTETLLTDYLNKSAYGVAKVKIDNNKDLFNAINYEEKTGGVSKKPLTTREVRSKLRDPDVQNNEKFIGTAIGSSVLSSTYANTTPPKIGRIESKKPTKILGIDKIGQRNPSENSKRVVPKPRAIAIIPDPVFNPNNAGKITSKTKLNRGISLAKFLGGRGDQVTLDHISKESDKLDLARQLYLHGEVLKKISNDEGRFRDFRLVVVEGVYRAGPGETLQTDTPNWLASKGRRVVYELIDETGSQASEKTFDLAVYLKDFLFYDKLTLDYDTFDPSGLINAQIIIDMPKVGEDYDCVYGMNLETVFNNKVQTNKELIEIIV